MEDFVILWINNSSDQLFRWRKCMIDKVFQIYWRLFLNMIFLVANILSISTMKRIFFLFLSDSASSTYFIKRPNINFLSHSTQTVAQLLSSLCSIIPHYFKVIQRENCCPSITFWRFLIQLIFSNYSKTITSSLYY